MSQTPQTSITAVGIDIGKNSFHIVGQDDRGAIVLRQKWSRGQVEAEAIAMFDLEANKAIARLVGVFNDRRLDLLEDVLHPEFHERGLSAFVAPIMGLKWVYV
jgi:hypothetical protein